MARDAVQIQGNPGPEYANTGQCGIHDSTIRSTSGSQSSHVSSVLGALAAGSIFGLVLFGNAFHSALPLLYALAFVGGLLSTWSPCGYSSLSLLRPIGGYSLNSVAGWTRTVITHGLGYLVGGLLLGGVIGVVSWMVFEPGLSALSLLILGVVAVGYGLHQSKLIRLPYPQRRAQVPHDARVRFPMWQTGLLYGFALGLNFLTYVRTPILYIVVLAAFFSGSVATAVGLFLVLNLGRFLPLLINFLPLHDWTVQRWLASNEQMAVSADALALSFGGAALLVFGLV